MDGTSTSTMNPPSRSPPQLPPYEAVQSAERPARHQYGRVPGTAEASWIPPASQAYPLSNQQSFPPPSQQPTPTRQTQPTTQPYQDGPYQTSRPELYQNFQQATVDRPRQPQPVPHREQRGYDPRLVSPQPGPQRRVEEEENTKYDRFERWAVSGQPQPKPVPQGATNYYSPISPSDSSLPQRTIPVPMQPQPAPQNNHNSFPPTPTSDTYYQQKTAIPLPAGGGHQSRPVPEQAAPPPLPQENPWLDQPKTAYPLSAAGAQQNRREPYEISRTHIPQANRNTSRPQNVTSPQSTAGAPQERRELQEAVRPPIPQADRAPIQSQRTVLPPSTATVPHERREFREPAWPPIQQANRGPTQLQKTALPSYPASALQGRRISHEVTRPPIPQTNRSTSQPPGQRNIRQPSPQPNKLHKASQPDIRDSQPPRSPDASQASPALQGRRRGGSVTAPPPGDSGALQDTSSRPSSYHSDGGSSDGKGTKLKSWIPGKSRNTSQDMTGAINGPEAWVIGGQQRIPYNVDALLNAKKVSELWDGNADTLVYLFPRESRRGPSFRIPSSVISSSPKLRVLAFGDSHGSLRKRARSFDGRSTLSANDATRLINQRLPNTPPYTPTVAAQDNQTSSSGSAESISSLGESVRAKESHLYFPYHISKAKKGTQQFAEDEHNHVVSVRNLFAFLTGRPLIATKHSPSVFSVLCVIADHLKGLGFSNSDGSTYGEAVTTSLSYYIEALGLTDVASSREKTLEGVVLGERLRSMELYNEAFTHAVGKYQAVHDMKSPLWEIITPNTRNRMELAFLDLTQRQNSIKLRLADFEFPSLFAGFADSTSSAASKVVRFKAWRSGFLALRRHTLSYYKESYGDWPPRAKSKKNSFSVSGLNRLVLKALYADFCSLYDLLADRESLTNRTMDAENVLPQGEKDLVASALRTIESEYDHSCPPVQPPVPFDTPKLPTMATLDPKYDRYTEQVRLQAETRKLQMHEAILILTKSHNLDSDVNKPFLRAFRTLEEKEAKGKTAQELTDQRYGYWLFVYVVLQALPMLVIDAPGLQHTDGVEYFLCQPPKGGAPWTEDSRLAWYGIADSSRIVALPTDVIEHGVEAIYQRSHCWVAGRKWLEAGHCSPTIEQEGQNSSPVTDHENYDPKGAYLQPGPARNHEGFVERQGRPLSIVAESISGSQAYSPATLSPPQFPINRPRAASASQNRRSIAIGLEQLPVPHGYNMSPTSPRLSPTVSPRLSPKLNPRHSPPLSAGPSSSSYGLGILASQAAPRSASVGNFQSATQGGSNFDAILKSLEKEKAKSDKSRRRSFMNLTGLGSS